jgi:phytoene dehydrogenase-like protein
MSGMRAVVVGSGIGGSAATLLLSYAGIPTTLLEKNRRIGGSCSGYDKDGFHVDIGTHMFCRGDHGPLGDVLRRVGRPGLIDFRRTKDIAEIRFPDARAPDGVAKIPIPAQVHRLPMFGARLARALKLSAREAAQAARFFTHILAMSDDEVRAWDHRTLEEFIEPYIDHPAVLGTFGFLLGLYFIIPYWEVSAGEALHCFRKMAFDNALSYPIGGSIAVPSTYCDLARELGAEIRTGASVNRIVVSGGKVKGVELSDGSLLPANIVISTSSVRTTVLRLVGPEHFPEAYADRAAKIRGSMIAVQAKIGLKKKLVGAGALVGGVGDGVDMFTVSTNAMKEMFASVTRGEIPHVVPFYCPVPTNFDPSLAPPGHQLLTLCAVAPTSDIALKDPSAAWEEAMLRTLRRIVPGLDEEVVFIDRFGVEFIERWIGKEFGPAVSTAQTPDQVGARRPPVHTPVHGLYLAGCNAGARGVGTELAAASAIECVDRILADLGRPLLTPQSLRRSSSPVALRPISWLTRKEPRARAV